MGGFQEAINNLLETSFILWVTSKIYICTNNFLNLKSYSHHKSQRFNEQYVC